MDCLFNLEQAVH